MFKLSMVVDNRTAPHFKKQNSWDYVFNASASSYYFRCIDGLWGHITEKLSEKMNNSDEEVCVGIYLLYLGYVDD